MEKIHSMQDPASAEIQSAIRELPTESHHAFRELINDWKEVGRYLLSTESHVFAFSIAANVLLSFFPFLLVMISVCRFLLGSETVEVALYVAIRDYFPGETGRFLAYNLKTAAGYSYRMEWVPILLLLFTANGVFMPLEVALNRAWNVKHNRSLVMNQVVSTALIFGCGALVLMSAAFTGAGQVLWSSLTGQSLDALKNALTDVREVHWAPMPVVGLFKLASVPITILILFLVYWRLPNTKVPWRLILPRAAVIGILLEVLKWINLLIWPWLYMKFRREYGPFVNSVTIIIWSFIAALVVLAGADWSARRARIRQWQKDQAAAELESPAAANSDRIGPETLLHPQD